MARVIELDELLRYIHMDSKDSGKDFTNNLIDTAVTIVLGTAIARVAPRIIDKRGTKVDTPEQDFDINFMTMEALCLGLSAAFVSSLHTWGVLPMLK